VTPTQYVDENLMHDVMSGSSFHDILHMVNKSPTDWFSKKQATVETATYGSKFVSAHNSDEQIIEDLSQLSWRFHS
jgi:hypothetical protein